MGKVTTVGKILLKQHVPAHLHEQITGGDLDSKGIGTLFSKLALGDSDVYKNSVSQLTRLGFEIATRLGSSIKLEDLLSPIDKDKKFHELEQKISQLKETEKDPRRFTAKLSDLYSAFIKEIEKELVEVGVKGNKTLAKIIRAGARGKPAQYMQTVFSPVMVANSRGVSLTDFPIKHSYAEGLTLPEYLVSTFGARVGEVSKKLCLMADTQVLTSNFKSKAIKDIKVGDLVMGSDKEGNISPVKVTNVFNNGIRPCYEFTFRKGNSQSERISVIATEDHKVLSRVVSSKNKKYTEPDFKVQPLSKTTSATTKHTSLALYFGTKYDDNLGVDEPYDLLLGLMLGDGCWRGHPLQFSCADLSLISDIESYLSSLGYQLNKYAGYAYGLVGIQRFKKVRKSEAVNEYGLPKVYSGSPFIQYIANLGLYNTKSETKFIPEVVHTWNNNSVARLIGGIFSTDGSVGMQANGKGASFRLAMVSENIVRTVKFLLETRFGVLCSEVGHVPKEKIPGAVNDLYYTVVSTTLGIRRFAQCIPLVGSKRQELTEVLEKIKLGDEYYPMNFVSKAYKGELPTFDIEVDHPDHLFVLANGIIGSNSVADSGYWSKQASRATMTLKVEENDCGTDNGIPVSSQDKDSIGCFLARPVGNFKKNNEVTQAMLQELSGHGHSTFFVRSPITCQSSRKYHSGAVCQLCVGRREYPHLMPLGSYVGITAGASMGEPLSQGTLGAKHSSGSAGGPSTAMGFKLVNQMSNIPKTFPNHAPVATKDGEITDIKAAPQGGHYVHQGDTEYYVQTGAGLHVKKGDQVEAGDILSEGVVNPAEIVQHKGIGEGRRYFATAMKKAFDDSGIGGVNRRNFELLAKAAIDHVKITHPEGLGDHLPGSIASYQSIEREYTPRHGSRLVRVDQAYNTYLEQPALHYSIGTRLTHKCIDMLKQHGVQSVMVNDSKPDFEPEMQSLLNVPVHEHDWMHQLYSTNLERRLIAAVNTGAKSDLRGPSPVAGLAYGKDFGELQTKKSEALPEEEESEALSFE